MCDSDLGRRTICDDKDAFLVGQAVLLLTQQAKELKSVGAMLIIGECFLNGWGTYDVEFEQAYDWLRSAFRGGHVRASEILHELFDVVYNCVGAIPASENYNSSKLAKLLMEASADGFPEAQTKLGNCFRFGLGLRKSEMAAAKLYRKAAMAGFPEAENELGSCYLQGVGVEIDEKKAVGWFSMAAKKGLGSAKWNLGTCFENGIGVTRDKVMAIYWMRSAAEEGYDLAVKGIAVREETYLKSIRFQHRFDGVLHQGSTTVLTSQSFSARGIAWKIQLHPHGHNTRKHLSLYLCLADSRMIPYDWSTLVKFSLTLVNHKDPLLSRKFEMYDRFSLDFSCWGRKFHTPVSVAFDPHSGFLQDGGFVVEAAVALKVGM